jgi:glyoxylase-like metal-dependent hydrolase (beta-lactamase superfamily II)
MKADNVVRKYYETATMSCVALPDELYFIDCGAIPKYAIKFREDMEKQFNRKTTYLMLTDIAWEHAYGMQAFSDVNIIITSVGKSFFNKNLKNNYIDSIKEQIIRNYADDEELRESLLASSLYVPKIGVSKEKEFGPSEKKLLFKLTKCHSSRSAIIYIASEKTLFTGDNLTTCFPPFSWFIALKDIYEEWEKLDIQYVVPGHGPVVKKSYITQLRQYYEDLIIELRKLKKQGYTVKQVQKYDNFPEYPGKKQKDWIKDSQLHSGRINSMIKYWYNQILKEPEIEDLMFVS